MGDEHRDFQGNVHLNEHEAHKSNMAGVGGGAMVGMAGGFLAIFIIGPILFAKLVGWIWGMLLKLGMVGRILTTVLMLAAGPLILWITMSFGQELFRKIGWFTTDMLFFGTSVVGAVWYFCWHYDAVKLMGASAFSNKIKNFAKFVWFGFLGAWLIGAFKSSSDMVVAAISFGASVAGFLYYFISTIGISRQAAQNPTLRIPLVVKAIALVAALGLTFINATVNHTAREAKIAKETAEMGAEAEIFKVGMSVIVINSGSFPDPAKQGSYIEGIRIYDSPVDVWGGNASSHVLSIAAKGSILTVTGGIERARGRNRYYLFVPVEHNGVKGFIEYDDIEPVE
jgi:hypothetical protein